MANSIEIISTERLRICVWDKNDLELALELWGDPRVTEFIDARGALTHQQVQDKLEREISNQQNFGVQYWKVVDKNKVFIGCCGLRPYKPEKRIYEIGFHIAYRNWGKGYACEAAKGVIAHAFGPMKIPKLFAGHNPKNTSSQKLLLKLGFTLIGEEFYPPTGLNHPSYELLNPNLPKGAYQSERGAT